MLHNRQVDVLLIYFIWNLFNETKLSLAYGCVAISSFLVVWLSPAYWLCGYLQLSGYVAISSFLVVWPSPAFWLCGYLQLSGCVRSVMVYIINAVIILI